MKVQRLHDLIGTTREVTAPTFVSRRLLLASDGLGYSLHDTVLHAGMTTAMWYRHHVESVYCIDGTGVLTDHGTGDTHRISPGTLYVLDGHERHELYAETDLRMVCVFRPPLTGREVHDDEGVYPLIREPAPDATAASG